MESQQAGMISELEPVTHGVDGKSSSVKVDEFDFLDVLKTIWEGRWIVVGVTTIFAVASVIYALSIPNEYKSSAMLVPVSGSGGSYMSRFAGQLGGLASLSGLNLPSVGGDNKALIAMELMKTWGFIEKFIEVNKLEVAVFAAKGWESETNQLIFDSELFNESTKQWVGSKPTSWDLYTKFRGRLKVSQDSSSGLVEVSVEYYSPFLAKEWVEAVVRQINLLIQDQEKQEAIRSIEYLNEKIQRTNVADMKAVFYQLIEEQTKTLMLAEVSDEYVFRTVSTSKVPEKKSNPKRVQILFLGIVLGVVLSILIVLAVNFRRK